jgi:hypothetical protein
MIARLIYRGKRFLPSNRIHGLDCQLARRQTERRGLDDDLAHTFARPLRFPPWPANPPKTGQKLPIDTPNHPDNIPLCSVANSPSHPGST